MRYNEIYYKSYLENAIQTKSAESARLLISSSKLTHFGLPKPYDSVLEEWQNSKWNLQITSHFDWFCLEREFEFDANFIYFSAFMPEHSTYSWYLTAVLSTVGLWYWRNCGSTSHYIPYATLSSITRQILLLDVPSYQRP